MTISPMSELPIFAHHTAKSLEMMKNYGKLFLCSITGCLHVHCLICYCSDRRILLAAGLKPSELPDHLGMPTDSDPAEAPNSHIAGQPDDRERRTDMHQFYENDDVNGRKPMQLTQIVAAQLRTNPQSDEHPDIFGLAVWKKLDEDTKAKLKKAAGENPPNMTAIADTLYTPIRNLLQKGPYAVPGPILDSFTSMKAPEVTEYVLTTQK